MSGAEVSKPETVDATDVRPSLAHYFKGHTLPATSLCGSMSIATRAEAETLKAPADAERCVVCLDLLTH